MPRLSEGQFWRYTVPSIYDCFDRRVDGIVKAVSTTHDFNHP
jgi:hypothetical protein